MPASWSTASAPAIGRRLASACSGLRRPSLSTVGQWHTLEQLHHEKRQASLVCAHIQYVDHVWVTHRGGRACLAQEARLYVLQFVVTTWMEQLDRDLALGQDVLGDIEHAHAARPQRGLDTIASADDAARQ